MSAFQWPQLMRAGMGHLRLTPEQFWAMTPAELMLMLGHGGGAAPMGRARLADLLRAYPDDPSSSEQERTQDE